MLWHDPYEHQNWWPSGTKRNTGDGMLTQRVSVQVQQEHPLHNPLLVQCHLVKQVYQSPQQSNLLGTAVLI